MKRSKFWTVSAAILAIASTAGAAVAQEGAQVGETQSCIESRQIRSTPIIDDKTILVKMQGDRYKRIDLMEGCHMRRSRSFAYETSLSRLCVSDILRVVDVGNTCRIDKIVTIDEAEARTLEARR